MDCRVSPFNSTTRHEGYKQTQTFLNDFQQRTVNNILAAEECTQCMGKPLVVDSESTVLLLCATMQWCTNATDGTDEPILATHEQKAGSGHNQEKGLLQLPHLTLKQLKQQRFQLLCIQLDLVCSCLSFVCLRQDMACSISVTTIYAPRVPRPPSVSF